MIDHHGTVGGRQRPRPAVEDRHQLTVGTKVRRAPQPPPPVDAPDRRQPRAQCRAPHHCDRPCQRLQARRKRLRERRRHIHIGVQLVDQVLRHRSLHRGLLQRLRARIRPGSRVERPGLPRSRRSPRTASTSPGTRVLRRRVCAVGCSPVGERWPACLRVLAAFARSQSSCCSAYPSPITNEVRNDQRRREEDQADPPPQHRENRENHGLPFASRTDRTGFVADPWAGRPGRMSTGPVCNRCRPSSQVSTSLDQTWASPAWPIPGDIGTWSVDDTGSSPPASGMASRASSARATSRRARRSARATRGTLRPGTVPARKACQYLQDWDM